MGIDMETNIKMMPLKEFFFHTLTLDITPEEAILELIDTFIEWYLYYKNNGQIKDSGNIKVQITNEKFIIESDYPGPPKDTISEFLTFGKGININTNKIGAYGIGTKRAIFKLGEDILFESDDCNEYFSIHIEKDWFKNDENWEILLKTNKSKNKLLDKIIISNLFNNISIEFENPKFLSDLKEKIKITYSYFLRNFINIKVNESKIQPFEFELSFEKGKIEPFYKEFIEDSIKVKILAGIKKYKSEASGWYFFCNNRLIMKNDILNKSSYYSFSNTINSTNDNLFLGFVFFSTCLFNINREDKKYFIEGKVNNSLINLFSNYNIKLSSNSLIKQVIKDKLLKIEDKYYDKEYLIDFSGNISTLCIDPIHLPLKSSKDDIREDSLIYRITRDYMINITKRFEDYIDVLKENNEDLQEILKSIKTKRIEDFLEENKNNKERIEIFNLIDGKTRKAILKGKQKISRIEFWESLNDIVSIKEKLGNVSISNEELGKKIFKYYINMEFTRNERS